MHLFTVSMENCTRSQYDCLRQMMASRLSRLHTGALGDGKLVWEETEMALHCHVDPERYTPSVDGPFLYEEFGYVMADLVIAQFERELLGDLVAVQVKNGDAQYRNRLHDHCLQLIDGDAWEEESPDRRNRRKLRLARHFSEYMAASDLLHLKGFMRFRMHDYLRDLHAVVEYAVDDLLLDQQYQEFISLLKYFVYAQEIKRPAVHIMHKTNNEFVVLDEEYNPIPTEQMEGLVVEMLDKEINLEDMIISTLITVSPKLIYIHTKEPELQVVRTIRQIFEERAVLCT